jgi:hypothetical protein
LAKDYVAAAEAVAAVLAAEARRKPAEYPPSPQRKINKHSGLTPEEMAKIVAAGRAKTDWRNKKVSQPRRQC